MTTILSLIATTLLSWTAAADIDARYEDCVKASRDDAESAKCLTTSSAELDRSLTDVVHQLLDVLKSKPDTKAKAKLLEDAHAKWLPSRDADCKLQAAVTMDTPEDEADAAKLCVYQAGVPRLRQYERFLGFIEP